MESATNVYAFLGLIGGMLGPVGVMMADYFIIRKGSSQLKTFIRKPDSTLITKAIITVLPRLSRRVYFFNRDVRPAFAGIYDISWFAGVILSCLGYTALMYIHPPYVKAAGRIVRERARKKPGLPRLLSYQSAIETFPSASSGVLFWLQPYRSNAIRTNSPAQINRMESYRSDEENTYDPPAIPLSKKVKKVAVAKPERCPGEF